MNKHLLKCWTQVLALFVSVGFSSTYAESSNPMPLEYASLENVKSANKIADFQYQEFYFSSERRENSPAQFTSSLNKCIKHSNESVKLGGMGYKVLKSLGHSDKKIATDSAMLCMEAKGWILFNMNDGSMERVDHKGQFHKTMSSDELNRSKQLSRDQYEWMRKYAPLLLDN